MPLCHGKGAGYAEREGEDPKNGPWNCASTKASALHGEIQIPSHFIVCHHVPGQRCGKTAVSSTEKEARRHA
eukprot:1161195-Pelagomonas_calceolata.AAC.10